MAGLTGEPGDEVDAFVRQRNIPNGIFDQIRRDPDSEEGRKELFERAKLLLPQVEKALFDFIGDRDNIIPTLMACKKQLPDKISRPAFSAQVVKTIFDQLYRSQERELTDSRNVLDLTFNYHLTMGGRPTYTMIS